jgi:23S rRNA pseudouridine1911/1915/1917 synthase
MADEVEDEVAEVLSIEVPALMEAMRVDRALSMLTGCSRAEASRLVAEGKVRLDEVVVTKASTPLPAGAWLDAIVPVPDDGAVEPEAEVDVVVVLEAEDFVVVDKRFDQVVHPGAGNRRGTLVAGIVARYPEVGALPQQGYGEISRPGIVHRLDKGTSGLLVVARTARGFESLSAQLEARTVERRYLGLVEGRVESAEGIVDAPIGRSARTPTKMAVQPDGRPARTHYEVIARLEPARRTMVGLQLETGRTHQIRVHMAAIGHPIVNDPRYGQRNERRLDPDRLALHAGRLGFDDPATSEPVRCTCPWPADLVPLGGGIEGDVWLEAD